MSAYDLDALRPGPTMRAAMLTGAGGPETLEIGEFPTPLQVNSEARVRVLAAGVNPIDAKTRSGKGVAAAIPSYPWVIGGEFAGVVLDAPYELAPFQPGEEVFGMVLNPRYSGANAEVVSVPIMSLARKPERLTMLEAGAVPLAALTAWAAIIEAGRVRHGMRILVHAGAGGVGHFAVQLGRIYGAKVVATASARNRDFLLELGADEVIDYTKDRFEDVISEEVDLVVDLIGNVKDDTGTRSIKVLRDGGTFLSVPTGSFPTMREELEAEGRELVGSHLKCSPDGRALESIAQLIEHGDLRVEVQESFPLERIADAHRTLEEGHVRGKLVLDLGAGSVGAGSLGAGSR